MRCVGWRRWRQEAEARLERSFRDEQLLPQLLEAVFDPNAAGMLLLLGRIMRDAGSHAASAARYSMQDANGWINNPYAFDQVARGIARALEAVRPAGPIVSPKMGGVEPGSNIDTDAAYREIGVGFARPMLAAVTGRPMTDDLKLWGEQVRNRLGREVVERIREHMGIQAKKAGGRRNERGRKNHASRKE
jgi:hypothetical protein